MLSSVYFISTVTVRVIYVWYQLWSLSRHIPIYIHIGDLSLNVLAISTPWKLTTQTVFVIMAMSFVRKCHFAWHSMYRRPNKVAANRMLLTILIINTIQWCLANRVRATVLSFPNYWAKDYGRWPNNDLPSEIYQFTEGEKPSLEWRHMRVVLSQIERKVGGLFSVWLARKKSFRITDPFVGNPPVTGWIPLAKGQ